jgi:hydrogenase/urease accessory protein HupE
MSTASRPTAARNWILFASVLCLLPGVATAHPVAQGAMVVMIAPEQITVRVTVSLEEVLVADAYGPDSSRAKSTDEAVRRHGVYLMKHLRISADGRPLAAEQVQSLSPNVAGRKDRFVYEFIYRLSAPASELRFQEDVLNEFEFAPGNRWEASYIVEIAEEGRPTREGLLMTSRQPLVVHVRENQSALTSATPRLDRGQVLRDYFQHGLLHILTGYDHLLFVTALVLSVRSLWEFAKVVTVFTLAHSITLALSAFDVLRLSSRIVEPAIAASIVFVAIQNVFWPRQTHGWTRLVVAFFFGLFHGLGFAGGLLEAMQGMSSRALVFALVGFSAGVEAGQQIVVLPTFYVLKIARGWRRERDGHALLWSRIASGAISLAGLVYLVAALRMW